MSATRSSMDSDTAGSTPGCRAALAGGARRRASGGRCRRRRRARRSGGSSPSPSGPGFGSIVHVMTSPATQALPYGCEETFHLRTRWPWNANATGASSTPPARERTPRCAPAEPYDPDTQRGFVRPLAFEHARPRAGWRNCAALRGRAATSMECRRRHKSGRSPRAGSTRPRDAATASSSASSATLATVSHRRLLSPSRVSSRRSQPRPSPRPAHRRLRCFSSPRRGPRRRGSSPAGDRARAVGRYEFLALHVPTPRTHTRVASRRSRRGPRNRPRRRPALSRPRRVPASRVFHVPARPRSASPRARSRAPALKTHASARGDVTSTLAAVRARRADGASWMTLVIYTQTSTSGKHRRLTRLHISPQTSDVRRANA